MDQGYFKIETNAVENIRTKAGHGSIDLTNVMYCAESTPVEDLKTHKQCKNCGYLTIKVIMDQTADDVK